MSSIEAIINRQIHKWETEKAKRDELPVPARDRDYPVITVSRQMGSRGSFFARSISEHYSLPIFHKEILDYIAENAGIQTKLVELFDEKVTSEFERWFDGMLRGRIVDGSDYLKYLARTFLAVRKHGGGVIVGRGANFLLRGDDCFHVRVVAHFEDRVRNYSRYQGMEEEEARRLIEQSDRDRKAFVKRHFNADIDDATAYDVVINSSHFKEEDLLQVLYTAIDSRLSFGG